MSFSPRNVSQLLVASATADQLTAVGDYVIQTIPNPDFVALDGGYQNLGAYIQVKTQNGTKVSDFIPSAVTKYTAATAVAPAAQVLTATLSGAVETDAVYVAKVILHDHIGSMLNERFILGSVKVASDGTYLNSAGARAAATLDLITDELAAQLQAGLDRAGEGFTVTETPTTLVVTGAIPSQRVGAKDGLMSPFELEVGIKPSDMSQSTGGYSTSFPVAVTTPPVQGDLIQLKNIEWFNSGYDKDPYRESGHFASFEADSNLVAAGVGATTAYGIFQFYKDRDATNIERQHRQLIVVGAGAAALGAAVAFTPGTAL